jgi:hypothetical protein
MNGLNETMVAFHTKVAGDIKKIEALFVDMAPEPQKGKAMPPGTVHNINFQWHVKLNLISRYFQAWFTPSSE